MLPVNLLPVALRLPSPDFASLVAPPSAAQNEGDFNVALIL